jgi:hypothetical protein
MVETRKTVTIVFTDVVGSTSLGERLDPEALRHVVLDLRLAPHLLGALEEVGRRQQLKAIATRRVVPPHEIEHVGGLERDRPQHDPIGTSATWPHRAAVGRPKPNTEVDPSPTAGGYSADIPR